MFIALPTQCRLVFFRTRSPKQRGLLVKTARTMRREDSCETQLYEASIIKCNMAYQKLCEVDTRHKIKFASGMFRLQDKVTELVIVKLKAQYIDQA